MVARAGVGGRPLTVCPPARCALTLACHCSSKSMNLRSSISRLRWSAKNEAEILKPLMARACCFFRSGLSINASRSVSVRSKSAILRLVAVGRVVMNHGLMDRATDAGLEEGVDDLAAVIRLRQI